MLCVCRRDCRRVSTLTRVGNDVIMDTAFTTHPALQHQSTTTCSHSHTRVGGSTHRAPRTCAFLSLIPRTVPGCEQICRGQQTPYASIVVSTTVYFQPLPSLHSNTTMPKSSKVPRLNASVISRAKATISKKDLLRYVDQTLRCNNSILRNSRFRKQEHVKPTDVLHFFGDMSGDETIRIETNPEKAVRGDSNPEAEGAMLQDGICIDVMGKHSRP